MKNYSHYSVEDFAQDLYFRQWVLENSHEAQVFWTTFCSEHPEQNESIELAKSMVKSLIIKDIPIAKEDIEKGIAQILNNTNDYKPLVTSYKRAWFNIAAAIALLIMAGLWWSNGHFLNLNKSQNTEGGLIAEQATFSTKDNRESIVLPDGSKVVLEKNSEIRYDKSFSGAVRTVYLMGEAFFDVVKNPNKPFIVYSGNLVTKVLGTSFRIKALAKDANVTVNVISGRVSVFANSVDKQKDPETDGLILTPNQKVIFEKSEEQLKRTLIEAPVVIVPKETLDLMVFDEASVDTILKSIQKAYGVDIVFDEDKLKKCALTTTLKNETLFDKLTIICRSIGATYKVVDAKVIIDGGDCD